LLKIQVLVEYVVIYVGI